MNVTPRLPGAGRLSGARGLYFIAPTAFDEDGAIDQASNDRLTDFVIEAGATGITVLGQAGEAGKLTHDEALAFALRVVRRATLPVVVGISGLGLAAMRALAAPLMDQGAAGVMVAPAQGLRTEDQVASYFGSVAEVLGADVPIVIQDYPLVFGVVMPSGLLRRIVNDVPSCVILKHEDWPGLDKITALRGYERDGSMRPLPILCGGGGGFLDLELARGADGAMTGYCFPDTLVELLRLAGQGQRDAAQDLFDAHLPILRYEHQPGIGLAARKYMLMRRGLIASDAQRKPRGALTPEARDDLEYLVRRAARVDPYAATFA